MTCFIIMEFSKSNLNIYTYLHSSFSAWFFIETLIFTKNCVAKILTLQVKELRVMSINIPWLEVLKACYPNAGISEETEIMVVSPQYTADIAVIMSTTDRYTSKFRNVVNFVFHCN